MINSTEDRNFDPIAEHFTNKVYGGLKGEIRLAVLRQDIMAQLDALTAQYQRPLRILDVGAGLAQISLELAKLGHEITINDVSENMLKKAHDSVADTDPKTSLNITWHICPYQALNDKLFGRYDLILCHALLEWLAEPVEIMDFFDVWLSPFGILSLCFYNPASFDYRNLIMGNFNLLNNPHFQADNKKSLTPNNPVAKEQVTAWLDSHHYQIISTSGLRVFHDYAPLKRGGHNHPEAVIEMELRYSQKEPFKWLGRYLHFMAKKSEDYVKNLKQNLLLEIKETTEIINQIEELTQAIETHSHLKMTNLLSLLFVEDEFTEELVGYLYDKKSSHLYHYIYNPNNDSNDDNDVSNHSIVLTQIDANTLSQETWITMLVIEEYLQLSEKEIAGLR